MMPTPNLDRNRGREAKQPGDARTFDNLILFTSRYLYEYKSFLSERLDWDATRLADICYCSLSASNYDLRVASATSIIRFQTFFAPTPVADFSLTFQGTGKNCDYGLKVFKDVMLPHLRRRRGGIVANAGSEGNV